VSFQKNISITSPQSSTEFSWGRGRGIKMPKIPKGRGCFYEIIFPEGH